MDLIILAIGTEIIKGRIQDTNSGYIAGRLYSAGFTVREIRCIGDDETLIKKTISDCFSMVEVIIATGGLGPTRDDMTKSAACAFFNSRLILDLELSRKLEKLFRRMDYSSVPELSRSQALVPEGARILPNPRGTASGLLLEKYGKLLFLLPGVPVEMKGLFEEEVLPILCERFGREKLYTAIVRTIGIGESVLAEKIEKGLSEREKTFLSYYPHGGMVDVVVSQPLSGEKAKKPEILKVADHAASQVRDHVYARDEKNLFQVLAEILSTRKLKLALAESCSGGLLSKTITDLDGSSAYFEAGVVSYSNKAKTVFLEVPDKLIAGHGAVSNPVALAMAEGVRKKTGADLSLAITGIAGPSGGSEEKPVGTVIIALSSETGTKAQRFSFGGDREQIRQRSTVKAAEILWRHLTRENR